MREKTHPEEPAVPPAEVKDMLEFMWQQVPGHFDGASAHDLFALAVSLEKNWNKRMNTYSSILFPALPRAAPQPAPATRPLSRVDPRRARPN